MVEPTNSEITTPISEKLTAFGSAVNVQASAFGMRTLSVICRSLAPSVRQKSISSFSIAIPPLNVLKKTRKNTMNQAVTTLEARPSPKIIVISGTKAMRGSEFSATMNGLRDDRQLALLAEQQADDEAA